MFEIYGGGLIFLQIYEIMTILILTLFIQFLIFKYLLLSINLKLDIELTLFMLIVFIPIFI